MNVASKSELREKLEGWASACKADNESPAEAKEIFDVVFTLHQDGELDSVDELTWKLFLQTTGHYKFIRALESEEKQKQWSDIAVDVVNYTKYTLLDMFNTSHDIDPSKALFLEPTDGAPNRWSYRGIFKRIRAIAAALHSTNSDPRVAILSDNCVEGACTDLACLMFDILVTPLNTHFDAETIGWIIDELKINVVVTDNAKHFAQIVEAQKHAKTKFEILTFEPVADESASHLQKIWLELSPDKIKKVLKARKLKSLHEVITVMFTSGSTGRPKGVSFSIFNLVSKRFARAAALPNVGEDEVLLCFLPLFHTFGRYFELLGMIFWRGTYVFTGNPSAERLLAMFPVFNPTGLVSIPLRWIQIFESASQKQQSPTSKSKEASFRQVVGQRFRWGISAAGYLAPHIFRYFHSSGVKVVSGFGMTEATGGITMTPPDGYVENSVGKPLPGINARLSDEGELQLSGAYVGRYLEDCGPGDEIPFEKELDKAWWLSTGDLFRKFDEGHYQIVDRIKDIYKNIKGQTVAPRRVEQLFENVAGIKRTFLVGDARSYNVLMIVPDKDDQVVKGLRNVDTLHDYFHQIVTTANQELPNYERVVNYTVLKRDFSQDQDELTAKGSYKRKVVQKNFADEIDQMYVSSTVVLTCGEYEVKIPRWFFRDIGILEDAIEASNDGVKNLGTDEFLAICAGTREGTIQIGDLVYETTGKTIDLGFLCRNPLLWIGNPALMRFYPCKEGWDLKLKPFSGNVFLPDSRDKVLLNSNSMGSNFSDLKLAGINQLLIQALFANTHAAMKALTQIEMALTQTDRRLGKVVRRRLIALSEHPEFTVRSSAYQILLLDEPSPDYSDELPAFIESGLPFLDTDTITRLAGKKLQRPRLEALRHRLYAYRLHLTVPFKEQIREQFKHILKLLVDYSLNHNEYYGSVRSELTSWILSPDKEISMYASDEFIRLYRKFEEILEEKLPKKGADYWESLIVFGDELDADEISSLKEVLYGSIFLEESVMLTFDEPTFSLEDVPAGGIWISRMFSRQNERRFRASIATKAGKHFDLQIHLNADLIQTEVMETVFWVLAISGHSQVVRVLPRIGCFKPELGAMSWAYLGDLSVWGRIRELSSRRLPSQVDKERSSLRKSYILGISAFFRAWRVARRRIVPGVIDPENVVVSGQDYQKGAVIHSISGWKEFENTLSLIRPIIKNFYRKVIANYPWCGGELEEEWIFDACAEELGKEGAIEFLEQLEKDIKETKNAVTARGFDEKLSSYIENLKERYHLNLQVENAIERYHEWCRMNSDATPVAKEQTVKAMRRLYRLDKMPELVSYHLYRNTYFKNKGEELGSAFDRLLERLTKSPETPATNFVELHDLQVALKEDSDREVFSNMIFPEEESGVKSEIVMVGEAEQKHLVVKTQIHNSLNETFTFREPLEAMEIGQIYRMFYREGYSKVATEHDKFFVVMESTGNVIGGVGYRFDDDDVVYLDGIVVAGPSTGKGIGGAILEHFCARMAGAGVKTIKTHFFLRNFYAKRGFVVDNRWGALVRHLGGNDE